jgi:hypothetical protein
MLETAGGEGIYTTADMEHPSFFTFKCRIVHMFESELAEEMRARHVGDHQRAGDLIKVCIYASINNLCTNVHATHALYMSTSIYLSIHLSINPSIYVSWTIDLSRCLCMC